MYAAELVELMVNLVVDQSPVVVSSVVLHNVIHCGRKTIRYSIKWEVLEEAGGGVPYQIMTRQIDIFQSYYSCSLHYYKKTKTKNNSSHFDHNFQWKQLR